MAEEKLTDRGELQEAPHNDDLVHVVDVSDTTDSAEGTSKKWKIMTWLRSVFEPLLPTRPVSDKEKYFLRADDSWAEMIVGSGGFAGNVYPSIEDSDVEGYKELRYDVDADEEELTIVANNGVALGATFLYPDEIDTTIIPSGVFRFAFWAKCSTTLGTQKLIAQVFLRHDDGEETDLFEVACNENINTTSYQFLRFEYSIDMIDCLPTDRMGVRIKGSTSRTFDTTITYIIGDGRGGYFNTTLQIRHNQLRDLNGDNNFLHVTSLERKSIVSEASSATPTPTGNYERNEYYLTALATAPTFAIPSGTAVNGNQLIIRIKDNGTARALSWNAIYRGILDDLPTTTTISKTMYLGFKYNSADSKWDLLALTEEE